MPRLRLGVLASVAATLIVGAPGCSGDGRTASKAGLDGGHDAASSDGRATPPSGGAAGSGSRDAARQGDGGAPGEGGGARAGSGGEGGGTEPPGGAGGTPGSVDAGCEPIDVPDSAVERELTLCTRLRSASVLAFDVTRAYDHAVFADCRVAWVIDLYLKVDMRADFLNALLAWNMRFWGCTAPAPTDFSLIFKPAPLSTGDATALIDDYLGVVTPSLDLSDLEIADMRAALFALAKPLVADPSCRLSRSSCVTEPGAGGAGSGGTMSGGAANGGATAMGSGGDTSAGGASGGGGTLGSGGDNAGGMDTGGSGERGGMDGGSRLDGGPPRRDAGTPEAGSPSEASAGGGDAASTP